MSLFKNENIFYEINIPVTLTLKQGTNIIEIIQELQNILENNIININLKTYQLTTIPLTTANPGEYDDIQTK